MKNDRSVSMKILIGDNVCRILSANMVSQCGERQILEKSKQYTDDSTKFRETVFAMRIKLLYGKKKGTIKK